MKKKKTDLNKKYSPKELAESFVFRVELSEQEKAEADKAMAEYRKKASLQVNEGQKLYLRLLALKFRLEEFARAKDFTAPHSFGNALRAYAEALGRKNYELANDLGIDPTRFSQIVNGKLLPSEKTVYRLDYHCDGLIPAQLWLELLHKEMEHKVQMDLPSRRREYSAVKKRLLLGPKARFVSNNSKRVQSSMEIWKGSLAKTKANKTYPGDPPRPLYTGEKENAISYKKPRKKGK